jgi:hypothetical protein
MKDLEEVCTSVDTTSYLITRFAEDGFKMIEISPVELSDVSTVDTMFF